MAGRELTTAVESDELSDSEAQRLKVMLGEVDLDDLSRRSPLRGQGADRYQYDLVVTDQGAEHQISVSEGEASPQLRALVDWLLSESRG